MRRLLTLALLLPIAGSFGCENGLFGIPNPRTVVEVDPGGRRVYLSNNKDVDVEVTGLSFNLTEKSAKLDKLTLHDNASAVRSASVQQMLVLVEQQKQVTEQINQLGQIVTAIAPWAAKIVELQRASTGTVLTTPWGSITKTTTPTPTTQPGG